MRRFQRSLGHALRGIATVWKEERNFRLQTLAAAAIILVAFILRFTADEIAILTIAMTMVLGGEVLNTVVEDLLNHIEPNHHPFVGKLKDMMAGFVLLSSIAAVIIGIAVIIGHIA